VGLVIDHLVFDAQPFSFFADLGHPVSDPVVPARNEFPFPFEFEVLILAFGKQIARPFGSEVDGAVGLGHPLLRRSLALEAGEIRQGENNRIGGSQRLQERESEGKQVGAHKNAPIKLIPEQ